MKKLLVIILITLPCFSLVACNLSFDKDGGEVVANLTQLSTPTISEVSNDYVYWDEVPNASSYVVKINSYQETTGNQLKYSISSIMDSRLETGISTELHIYVKAKGNQILYSDSEWSNEYVYTYTKKAINSTNKLATPEIIKIEYDKVYWTAVENADLYTVIVNDNYECTLRGTECYLKDVKWNGETISNYGKINVTVFANGYDTYLDSDKAIKNDDYFYVPISNSDTSDLLIKYSIGFGYNLVRDEYLNITKCSKKSVFNIGKLLTIGEYKTTNNSGFKGTSYNYKSIDEFISKTKVSFEYGQTTGCSLIGSLSMQVNADIGFDYKKYEYNETYVYEYALTYKDHKITNFSDDNLLIYCLSDDFMKDLKKESVSTQNMTDDQLVKYLYETYGTHAILGITTGASYTAKYVVSTNNKDIAADVTVGFKMSTAGGGAVDQIIQKDFNLSAKVSESISSSSSETKANFSIVYNGGNGGAATSPSDCANAINKWSGSVSEDNAISVRFTDDGAISLVTILSYIDGNFASKFNKYVIQQADEIYNELFSKYNKSATLPLSIESSNNNNILVVDLSGAQKEGNLSQYSYPTLNNGVFEVSPTMLNRNINAIKIIGAYDTYESLINSFSIKLSSKWDIDQLSIILDNVGIIVTNDYGLIDLSDISSNLLINLNYQGKNVISGKAFGQSQKEQISNSIDTLNILPFGNADELKIYGCGTQESPILIFDVSTLKEISNHPECCFKLIDNINLENNEWSPIESFNGILDGNGFGIQNLDITISSEQYSTEKSFGFIDVLNSNGVIKDLSVSNISIYGASQHNGAYVNVGAMCGNNYGKIINVSIANSSISINRLYSNIGCICGKNNNIITDCDVSNSALNGNGNGGGIVGYNAGVLANSTFIGKQISSNTVKGNEQYCSLHYWLVTASGKTDGNKSWGAIAGINTNTITNVELDNVYFWMNGDNWGTPYIGYIVGTNNGACSGTFTLSVNKDYHRDNTPGNKNYYFPSATNKLFGQNTGTTSWY